MTLSIAFWGICETNNPVPRCILRTNIGFIYLIWRIRWSFIIRMVCWNMGRRRIIYGLIWKIVKNRMWVARTIQSLSKLFVSFFDWDLLRYSWLRNVYMIISIVFMFQIISYNGILTRIIIRNIIGVIIYWFVRKIG